jgi:hypothetical protein
MFLESPQTGCGQLLPRFASHMPEPSFSVICLIEKHLLNQLSLAPGLVDRILSNFCTSRSGRVQASLLRAHLSVGLAITEIVPVVPASLYSYLRSLHCGRRQTTDDPTIGWLKPHNAVGIDRIRTIC